MKKNIYKTLILFLIGVSSFGQSPSWVVNENDFQYTMSFVAFLNVEGDTLRNTSDKVAAFVNGECRGVANLTYVENEDKYYAYLTVFSNQNSETINFKIYDAVNDKLVNVQRAQTFEIDEHYGDLFQAYSIAYPALSTASEILEFGFKDIVVNDRIVDGNQITLFLDGDTDITNLNAVFELNSGATLYVGTVGQVSGGNSMDFSNPIQFQVRSEDQSVLEQWAVIVELSSGSPKYYKKDAVCYVGGVIKIVFPQNNEEVTLLKNSAIINTSAISNGEVIFSDLDAAIYTVKVGGNSKEIIINQKK